MNAIFHKYKAPLEALIFTSPSPLTVEEITDCLSAYYDHSPVTIQETVALLDQLRAQVGDDPRHWLPLLQAAVHKRREAQIRSKS